MAGGGDCPSLQRLGTEALKTTEDRQLSRGLQTKQIFFTLFITVQQLNNLVNQLLPVSKGKISHIMQQYQEIFIVLKKNMLKYNM